MSDWEDDRDSIPKLIGSALREVAVMLGVFGILEAYWEHLHNGKSLTFSEEDWWWFDLKTMLWSGGLFIVGMVLEVGRNDNWKSWRSLIAKKLRLLSQRRKKMNPFFILLFVSIISIGGTLLFLFDRAAKRADSQAQSAPAARQPHA